MRRRLGGRAALALLAAALLLLRPPRAERLRAAFPGHSPATLAHFLADFSNHPALDSSIGEWSVQDESGNLTWWRYRVQFTCGSGCFGHATLEHTHLPVPVHASTPAPNHAAASVRDRDEHVLRVQEERCVALLPLLPWPSLCEETHTEMEIRGHEGGGAALAELVTRWATAPGWLLGAPLGAERHVRLARLRQRLS